MKISFMLILLIMLLLSCTTIVDDFGKKRPDPPPQIITLKGVEDGLEFNNNISRPDKILIFDKVDKEYEIMEGDAVLLKLDYNIYQDDDLFIMSRYNKDSKKITIGLYDRFREETVILKSKCDVIEIRGINEIPKINIDTSLDLKPEQIIITPMFDENCNRLGYQIRYGSPDRGCNSVAKSILNRFYKCTGVTKKVTKGKVKQKCWAEIWFGVKCK